MFTTWQWSTISEYTEGRKGYREHAQTSWGTTSFRWPVGLSSRCW